MSGNFMRVLFVALLLIILVSCRKNKCNIVTVTQNGIPCSFWGIKAGDQTYPADSIPDNFKQEGALVCVDYELFTDTRLCACCGGTWARIKSIRYPKE